MNNDLYFNNERPSTFICVKVSTCEKNDKENDAQRHQYNIVTNSRCNANYLGAFSIQLCPKHCVDMTVCMWVCVCVYVFYGL